MYERAFEVQFGAYCGEGGPTLMAKTSLRGHPTGLKTDRGQDLLN
jgi:hypothetical protein